MTGKTLKSSKKVIESFEKDSKDILKDNEKLFEIFLNNIASPIKMYFKNIGNTVWEMIKKYFSKGFITGSLFLFYLLFISWSFLCGVVLIFGKDISLKYIWNNNFSETATIKKNVKSYFKEIYKANNDVLLFDVNILDISKKSDGVYEGIYKGNITLKGKNFNNENRIYLGTIIYNDGEKNKIQFNDTYKCTSGKSVEKITDLCN